MDDDIGFLAESTGSSGIQALVVFQPTDGIHWQVRCALCELIAGFSTNQSVQRCSKY